MFNQARAELRRGDLARARADVLEGLKAEPRSISGLNLLGVIETEDKDYGDAVNVFEEALRLDPMSAETHHNLAECYAKEGRADLAKSEYLTAQALERAHRIDSRGASSPKKPIGDTADLGIDYSDSADLKPGGISGSVDAGGYSSQTRARGSELRQALGTLPPASPAGSGAAARDKAESADFQRASGLLLGGDYARAADAFGQGAAQFPESSRMMLGLGVADYSRGLYPQAIEALCKAVDLSPDQPQAYFFLAQAYSTSPAKADDVLTRVARYASSHPENAPAQYYEALCLWRSRTTPQPGQADPTKVEELLRSAIALDSSLAEAHYQLGVVLADESQDQQAAAEFERAVAFDPNWAEAHYRLGQLYRRAGQADKAQSEFDASERLRKSGDSENQRLSAEIRRLLGD
jgi:tetratricopeptide (TPR) repeat protein